MKKNILAITCLIVLMAFVINQDNKSTFKKLYTLEGTWITKSQRGNTIGETWIKVNEDLLQNKGFYIKGKDTIVTERVALHRTNKDINYTSTVENQNNHQPIAFKLTSSDNNLYVFENPTHDFPKRIIYEIVSADSVHAWIDAGKGGESERQDFYYHRAK